MAISDVLNFTETPIIDEGIERYEFHEPVAHTNLNREGEIRINIEQQDLFTLPSEAFLLFEGRLLKADGTAYANADAVSLTNSGIMHLFSQITYQLSNQEVESDYHLGQATTMLGMLKYPNDFQLAQGLNQLCIPLKHIFGFFEDYNKVIYEFKHTLTLVRKSDDDAIFRVAAVAAGQVNLDKISLFIPHVIPSDVERNNLYKAIESKVTLQSLFVHDKRLKSSVVDVQIKATFNAAVPAGTAAFAILISDRMMQFQSDGNKMNIVY
ncbi:uncharacterized protein LOC136084055 [Hydra vulgaris]|uniref:uncharacterized protein LOC136084055 n=1 Tax=Hydra vulgaris TaxID=6087 RepID=UPI0032EA0ABF